MNDRSSIPMRCSQCFVVIGSLDCPIEWRSLGDWLLEQDIKPLCKRCFEFLQMAVQEL